MMASQQIHCFIHQIKLILYIIKRAHSKSKYRDSKDNFQQAKFYISHQLFWLKEKLLAWSN